MTTIQRWPPHHRPSFAIYPLSPLLDARANLHRPLLPLLQNVLQRHPVDHAAHAQLDLEVFPVLKSPKAARKA